MPAKYRFQATRQFWEQVHALTPPSQRRAEAARDIFFVDPFDSRLRTHKIHSLSRVFRRTVYAVVIEGDLPAAFFIEGDLVVSFAIGTHDIYKT